jgi:hypothetical protein
MTSDPERERALRILRVAHTIATDQSTATRKLINAGIACPAALDGLVGLQRSNYAITCNPIYLIGDGNSDEPKNDRRKIWGLMGEKSFQSDCADVDTAEIRRLTDALLDACLRAEPLPPS